ncbi:Zinc finger, C3HC4 RING-type [Dillenia turbinata]|uniref:Zinc finger, C3HC4 RING-type n=1 Tax=Dillenia turbinata TaxID=194707 RepID=A0AAN8UZZ0_9MAGN
MACTVGGEGNDGEEELPNYYEGSVLIDSDDREDSFYSSEDEQNLPKRRKGTQKKKRVRPKKKQKDSGMNEGEGVELGGNAMKKKRGKKMVEDTVLMWEVWEEEHERWINENIKLDTDLDQPSEMMSETIDTPSDLIMPLLRYQKEWLAWALKQEESTIKGGILADEMGMGKTIQAIALVLAKREISRALPITNEPEISPSASSTLVICPVVAVMQWVNEIIRFTLDGSTKVLVYHGSNRGKSAHQFADYDFVITTYSIVESEYRKNVLPPKEKCMWCGKAFQPHKLPIHLKYFCGPDAMRTAEQSKQQTKKRKNWQRFFKKKKPAGHKKKGASHNKKKKNQKEEDGYTSVTEGSESSEEDEVLGSSSVKYAAPEQGVFAKKSILHSFMWERIILDEAHFIKDRRSNTARAVLALESSYKWGLSGTPLQNRVRFLRIIPYSFYFCKDCDCRCLDYSTSTQCSNCEHKSVRHFCWWNRYIASPIQSSGNGTSGRGAMLLLKHKILKSILLRRTKKGRAADLALPPRIVFLRRDALDVKEEDYYTSLYNESQAQFNTYVQQGTVMNNYAHIFELLTRLRQAVDHPYLVVYSKTVARKSEGLINSGDSEEHVCGLCNDPAEDPVVTSCAHVFCKPCLIDFSTSLGHVSCPSCSKPLTVDLTTNTDASGIKNKVTVKGFKHSSILNRIWLEDFQTSTKIDALREEIRFMVERDGSAKGIVFSQFTSFLDLINYSLQKSGVSCVQLVGSMSLSARDAAISKFSDDPDCKIFLMSLKAGGVALNLTVASHVFLMDPWWNPAVERQAQDRIHRIGQYKPIRIVRFVIENTIEERILKLQEKKELVFEGTVGGSNDALGKLTEADMRFLFVT